MHKPVDNYISLCVNHWVLAACCFSLNPDSSQLFSFFKKWCLVWTSSVSFKMVFVHLEKQVCAPPIFQKFPQCCLWNSSSVCLIDNGLLLSFEGKLLSSSSFYTSLLQTVDGVMSLALCPQCLKLLKNTSDLPRHKPFVMVALPATLSAWSFPFTPAYPGKHIHRVLMHVCQSGFPTPLFTFGYKLIGSVRRMARVVWLSPLEAVQHLWLFSPLLSSWRLRLHCLHGWGLHLAWQWSKLLPLAVL